MSYDCPHGNRPDERCAQCVAAGQRQPGDHHTRRFTDPARVEKQTRADDDLIRRTQRQVDERIRIRAARTAAEWSRRQPEVTPGEG